MRMSLPSPAEFAMLDLLAFEIREIFAARSYNIDVALDRDDAFRESRSPRSSLIRALFARAAKSAEIKTGKVSLEPGVGGSLSFRSFDDDLVERWYRILKAKVEDEAIILYSNETILEAQGDSLFTEERWVFAYTVDSNNTLDSIFVAEILGITAGAPGRLILGDVHYLAAGTTTTPPGPGKFTPADEDLDLGDESAEDDDDTGDASDAG